MRVAIDVDGVLAEQVMPVLRRVYPTGDGMGKEEILAWNQPLRGTPLNIKDEIEKNLGEEDFVLAMEPLPGAVAGVQRLSEMGCRITIATARLPNTSAWTKAWLKRHSIPFDTFLSTAGKDKSSVEADLMVDDYPGNLEAFAKNGGVPVLFDQPWNRQSSIRKETLAPRLVRAKTWPEVVEIVGNSRTG